MKQLTMVELITLRKRLNTVSNLLMKGEHLVNRHELQMEFNFLVRTLENMYMIDEVKEAI